MHVPIEIVNVENSEIANVRVNASEENGLEFMAVTEEQKQQMIQCLGNYQKIGTFQQVLYARPMAETDINVLFVSDGVYYSLNVLNVMDVVEVSRGLNSFIYHVKDADALKRELRRILYSENGAVSL